MNFKFIWVNYLRKIKKFKLNIFILNFGKNLKN